MIEIYSFFNSKEHDRLYNAKHWADYFFPLFTSGVFNGDLQVTENGGMNIVVNPGYAWIDGYGYHLTEKLVLDLETASGNMNRADSIVLRLDLSNRWIKLFCKTGNYFAGTPIPPEGEKSATIHELVLCRITIPAGSTKITQDMIQDTRMDDKLCGWVCGTVNQIKFEQITAQFKAFMQKYEESLNTKFADLEEYEKEKKIQFDSFQAELIAAEQELHNQHKKALEDYLLEMKETGNKNLSLITEQLIAFRNENEAEFLAWFEDIKGILSGDQAGALLLKINALTQQVEDLQAMLLAGMIHTRLLTGQGDYITDDKGNPLLMQRPICQCQAV